MRDPESEEQFCGSAYVTPTQRDELRDHLANALTKVQCDLVIRKLDVALTYYTKSKVTESIDVSRMKKFENFTKRVRACVDELQDLLAEPIGYLPRTYKREPLQGALTELDNVARDRQADIPLRKGKGGRYRKTATNLFISNVYAAYPRGTAKRSDGSNFEMTVEKLFKFANVYFGDIHSVIKRALADKKPTQ